MWAEARQSRADVGRKRRVVEKGDERRESGKEVSPADGCWVGTAEGGERGGKEAGGGGGGGEGLVTGLGEEAEV